MKCWQVEISYINQADKKKRMLSEPLDYTAARDLLGHYERRGWKARLIEIEDASANHRAALA